MKKYNLKYLEKELNAIFYGNLHNEFCKILIDSRNTVVYKDCLFISLSGKQHDGHKFINELYQKGVKSFIISKEINYEKYPDASFLKVSNAITALQKLATIKRKEYKKPILAITGSNGKTIVKEWLFHLLAPKYKLSKSPKSFNSQIGVPLSIWMIDSKSDLAIIEAGISQSGEMEKLENIIKPTYGILTNIGSAHQSNFKNIEHKLDEKLKLFSKCKNIICNLDYLPLISNNILTWSQTNKNADIYNPNNTIYTQETDIELIYKKHKYSISIPFTDSGSIKNAITCFAFICRLFKIPDQKTLSRFKTLPGVKMRLETLNAINNGILINDSYNSDINSLEIALDYLNQKKGNKSTLLILSDILQNSSDTKQFYSNLSKLIKEKKVDKFIGIGETLYKNKSLFGTNEEFYKTTKEFLYNIKFSKFNSSAILLKGAREFKFEEISKRLQAKSHESYLETDMNLMRDNLMYFRSILKPETKIMAMVKAFSYGSGYCEISSFLQHNRIDYLAVAYADEGVELRDNGIFAPIMVMNPSARDFNKMIEYNLEPEIYSINILEILTEELLNFKIDKFPIHIKLNTGMNRLGIKIKDIKDLCSVINKSNKIDIKSVFSHLSGSDNPNLDSFTKEQIALFDKGYNYITKNTGFKPYRHILNSSGIIRFTESQYEMVRLGIGLYGLIPEISNKICQVSTFKSVISQINTVYPEETVSYNRSGKIFKPSKIATIPVGYADGIDRRLGNGNWHFIINDKKAYTIGNICMDMCMVDITGIDARENDEVIVFGLENNIIKMADILKTIPYEIITGISQRVKRIYTEE